MKSVKEESFEISGCATGFYSEDTFFGQQTTGPSAHLEFQATR